MVRLTPSATKEGGASSGGGSSSAVGGGRYGDPLLSATSPSAHLPLMANQQPVGGSPIKKDKVTEPFHVGSLNQLDAHSPSAATTVVTSSSSSSSSSSTAAATTGMGFDATPKLANNFVRRTIKQATSMIALNRRGDGGVGDDDGLPSYCAAPDEVTHRRSEGGANSGACHPRPSLSSSSSSVLHTSTSSLIAQLNAEYDVSDALLRQAFETMDHEGKGTLTYEQVQTAILQLESLKNLPRTQLTILLKGFDKYKGTTCEQFISGIQEFVTSLYKEGEGAVQELFLCDYSRNELSFRPIKTDRDSSPPVLVGMPMTFTDLFALDPAPPEGTVRWISLVGVDLNVIMSLAIKYKIHHLMVEDVIGSRLERPKLEVVGDVKHILLSHIYVDTHGKLQKFRTHIFLVGENTVIFIQNGPSQVNEQVQLKLKTSMSLLRLSNASFLVYSLVDSLVNEMQITLQHYLTLLRTLHHVSVSPEKMHQLFHVTRDLAMFAVWIAPVAQILLKLQDEALWAATNKLQKQHQKQELQVHLMDLAQNVMALHEEINLMTRWAESKSRELDSLQQLKTSKVVLLLTLVTTAFLPLQLLAGVYGMNFPSEEMPLIRAKWGYAGFWILGLSVSMTILLIFKLKRWF